MKCTLLLTFAILSFNANASWFSSKPKNYDECITKNMKGVTSDYAAKAIVTSCLRMFPDAVKKQPKNQAFLGSDELNELRKTAKLTTSKPTGISGGGGYFDLSKYGPTINGSTHTLTFHNNTKHLITNIVVTIYPDSGGEYSYQDSVYVEGFSTGSAYLHLNKEHTNAGFKYNIISAEIGD